jgi:thiol-disulfide isomerase/thioredoxin
MKMKLMLFGLLLIAALMLAACGPAASQSEPPVAAPASAMAEDDAAMAEGDTMEKSDAAMDDTMAKEDDAAMSEGHDAMVQEDDAAMVEGNSMSRDDISTTEGDTMVKEDAASMNESHEAMAEDSAPMADNDAMAEDDAALALPAWLTAQLVDVNTGQAFTIADQRGKVVLVETLAVWCSTCLRQQKQVQALHEALGEREDLVSVGLDIDLNESAEQLRAHTERNGFDWIYAVATPEVAREIGQLYGNLFLNPPSTPMLIVDRQGQVHPLSFGIKSAGDLQEALAPFLAEDM